jgi:hypothetical protein
MTAAKGMTMLVVASPRRNHVAHRHRSNAANIIGPNQRGLRNCGGNLSTLSSGSGYQHFLGLTFTTFPSAPNRTPVTLKCAGLLKNTGLPPLKGTYTCGK